MSVRSNILSCTSCELHSSATSPVPFSGPAPNPFIVIGEAPGEQEDIQMSPFVGPSGKLLKGQLDSIEQGWSEVPSYLNVVCCFPHGTPRLTHVQACQKNLLSQLTLLAPRYALVVGGVALNALWPDVSAPLNLSQYRGAWLQLPDSWGLPEGPDVPCLAMVTWHPSAVLRAGGMGSGRGKEFAADVRLYVEACRRLGLGRPEATELPSR